jgi:hypothetical protein
MNVFCSCLLRHGSNNEMEMFVTDHKQRQVKGEMRRRHFSNRIDEHDCAYLSPHLKDSVPI